MFLLLFVEIPMSDTGPTGVLKSGRHSGGRSADGGEHSVQVNIPAESGDMGILASHVPSIEQLKPGLIEIIEEQGGSKQFFCTFHTVQPQEK